MLQLDTSNLSVLSVHMFRCSSGQEWSFKLCQGLDFTYNDDSSFHLHATFHLKLPKKS